MLARHHDSHLESRRGPQASPPGSCLAFTRQGRHLFHHLLHREPSTVPGKRRRTHSHPHRLVMPSSVEDWTLRYHARSPPLFCVSRSTRRRSVEIRAGISLVGDAPTASTRLSVSAVAAGILRPFAPQWRKLRNEVVVRMEQPRSASAGQTRGRLAVLRRNLSFGITITANLFCSREASSRVLCRAIVAAKPFRGGTSRSQPRPSVSLPLEASFASRLLAPHPPHVLSNLQSQILAPNPISRPAASAACRCRNPSVKLRPS